MIAGGNDEVQEVIRKPKYLVNTFTVLLYMSIKTVPFHFADTIKESCLCAPAVTLSAARAVIIPPVPCKEHATKLHTTIFSKIS